MRERLGPDAGRLSFAVPFINDLDEFLRLWLHLDLPDDVPLSVFVETPAAVPLTTGFCAGGQPGGDASQQSPATRPNGSR